MKSLFYKPIKIKHPDEDVFIWSDFHYDHDPKWSNPLWKLRGFNSVREHNSELIRRWNEKIKPTSVVFLLGDTCFGKDSERNIRHLFDVLNFHYLYLCPGNHTSGYKQLIEGCDQNILQIGEKTVIFCPNYIEALVNGKSTVLSHFPILSWNGQGGGSYHFFGHVHSKLHLSEVGKKYLDSNARCLEVTIEKFPSPPSFLELKGVLSGREKVSFDGHDSNTQNPF
jgi:calcineurin-like phosphoesterase family protein